MKEGRLVISGKLIELSSTQSHTIGFIYYFISEPFAELLFHLQNNFQRLSENWVLQRLTKINYT